MICIAGKNNIAVDVLDFVIKSMRSEEVVVVPNRDDSGQDGWQKSLRKAAESHRIPIVDLDALSGIKELTFLSLEYDRLLRPKGFQSERLFNVHFSLLPSYKGVYTSIWPILNGEKCSGVTLHYIDAGIDTGDIIDQIEFSIRFSWTSRDLYGAYLRAGTELAVRWLPRLLRDDLPRRVQPAEGALYYGRGSLDFSSLEVDFRHTASQVHDFVRGFSFPEYQMPRAFGRRLRRSAITPFRSRSKPGTVLEQQSDWCRVSTIDYDVRLEFEDQITLSAIDSERLGRKDAQ